MARRRGWWVVGGWWKWYTDSNFASLVNREVNYKIHGAERGLAFELVGNEMNVDPTLN